MGRDNLLGGEYLEWEILCEIIYSSVVKNANHMESL